MHKTGWNVFYSFLKDFLLREINLGLAIRVCWNTSPGPFVIGYTGVEGS